MKWGIAGLNYFWQLWSSRYKIKIAWYACRTLSFKRAIALLTYSFIHSFIHKFLYFKMRKFSQPRVESSQPANYRKFGWSFFVVLTSCNAHYLLLMYQLVFFAVYYLRFLLPLSRCKKLKFSFEYCCLKSLFFNGFRPKMRWKIFSNGLGVKMDKIWSIYTGWLAGWLRCTCGSSISPKTPPSLSRLLLLQTLAALPQLSWLGWMLFQLIQLYLA